MEFGSFIKRNEKKLLLVPVLLLPLAIGVVLLIPKPKPVDLPPIPRAIKPQAAPSTGLKVTPVINEILHAYQGLEEKVYAGVGMPEADREAFYRAKEQIQICNENADAGMAKLDQCIAEHLTWLVNEAKDGLVPEH